MKTVFTVEQVNLYIKGLFTEDRLLQRIYLQGEVSNCKYHTSGHIYFSLKDEKAAISCAMYKFQQAGLKFRLENGQKVIVHGKINVYEKDGTYRIYADDIQKQGMGELYERFEALKKTLDEMGMFAPEYKKPIPKFAMRVGVVTAQTGAAIQDILKVARKRNPYVEIILYSAKVQGDGAAQTIVAGIEALEKANVDVMIVGRGGGSIEDLWAFNEELVARAVFGSSIPIISAVGHEIDTTIIDYVADLRAPTPSAAAEMAVFSYEEFTRSLQDTRRFLSQQMEHKIELSRTLLLKEKNGLQYNSPEQKLLYMREKLVSMENLLVDKMNYALESAKHRVALGRERLKGLSPLEKLGQGFSLVTNSQGHTITSVKDVKAQDKLKISMKDGNIFTVVQEIFVHPKEE